MRGCVSNMRVWKTELQKQYFLRPNFGRSLWRLGDLCFMKCFVVWQEEERISEKEEVYEEK